MMNLLSTLLCLSAATSLMHVSCYSSMTATPRASRASLSFKAGEEIESKQFHDGDIDFDSLGPHRSADRPQFQRESSQRAVPTTRGPSHASGRRPGGLTQLLEGGGTQTNHGRQLSAESSRRKNGKKSARELVDHNPRHRGQIEQNTDEEYTEAEIYDW